MNKNRKFSIYFITCLVNSCVKSTNNAEFDVFPDKLFLFAVPLLLTKLFENKLLFLLCCNCAPGALLVLWCELFDPKLDVLADSQLSLLPFCNACNENF